MHPSGEDRRSPWPHRFAVLLCCATFPLIWVGGLVTTYDAGMAVPDWPNTYGYNLFLYPWTTWLAGPWDLFIEHGHRLLGALVGLLAIGLVVSAHRGDARGWLRGAAWAALALVVLQGVLGGARVLLDERLLAMVHGVLGPTFFAFCAALAVFTSPLWRDAAAVRRHPAAGGLHRLALLTAALALVQLAIGAQLRHIPVTASPGTFSAFVAFHLLLAAVLAVHVIWLSAVVLRRHGQSRGMRRPALLLIVLVCLQLLLGPATWVVKYGWPHWFAGFQFAAAYTVQAHSMTQAMVVTLHVATGSLLLAVTTVLALRSLRLVRVKAAALGSTAVLLGWAT